MAFFEYRYPKLTGDSDALDLIRTHVQNLQASRQSLTDLISRHGNTVLSEWTSWTASRRSATLRSAALPAGINPSARWVLLTKFHEMQMEIKAADKVSKTLEERPIYRATIMLPIADYRTLQVDSSALLCLIHNRIEYPPSKWASLDVHRHRFGDMNGLLELQYNRTWFSVLETSYGQPSMHDATREGEGSILHFKEALLTFEFQSLLHEFLVRMVNNIVSGTQTQSHGDGDWNSAARSFFVDHTDLSMFSRLEPGITQMCERHLCSPPGLDLGVLDDVARNRQDGAEDELRLLQNGAFPSTHIA